MKAQFKDLEIREDSEQTDEEILNNIRQAVEEMKLIKTGKLKGRPLQELLDEL